MRLGRRRGELVGFACLMPPGVVSYFLPVLVAWGWGWNGMKVWEDGGERGLKGGFEK